MPEDPETDGHDQQLMHQYFEAMSAGEDFARFLTDDVTWLDVDTGTQVSGPAAVRDYIVVLHSETFDARPEGRSLVVADGHAYLEGDFVGAPGDPPVPFCVAYDLGEGGISAMRFYASFDALRAYARHPMQGPAEE